MPLPKVQLRPGEFAVLTLTEPWATLVTLGEKAWETRGWPTAYRGLLLIHAAKSMPRYAQELCVTDPFESALAKHGIRLPIARPEDLGGAAGQSMFPFHFGSIIGAVVLRDTVRTEKVAETLQHADTPRSHQELAFGFFDAGRWAFRLESPRRFAEPIPIRGQLGIWTLECASPLSAKVRPQVEGIGA
jgi:hypothetical protein